MINPKYVLMIVAILPGLVFAGSNKNKGANPNGKPFIELAGQIVEIEGEVSTLQDQVDSLVTDVNDLEGRIGANEDAIADLQAANADLQAQITANAGDIGALQSEVDQLEQYNADLEVQINALGDADGELQAAIDINSGMITTLNQTIADLGVSLQDQIDNNSDLILIMQDQINYLGNVAGERTRILDGVCPDGETVNSYDSNLQVFSCFRRTFFGDGTEVEYPVSYRTVTIGAGRILDSYLSCGDSFEGFPYARNFSYTQSGGVELLQAIYGESSYNLLWQNTTNQTQVVNMAVGCHTFR